jgi:hypothetical protein
MAQGTSFFTLFCFPLTCIFQKQKMTISNASHGMNRENPEVFNATLLDFLEENKAQQPAQKALHGIAANLVAIFADDSRWNQFLAENWVYCFGDISSTESNKSNVFPTCQI